MNILVIDIGGTNVKVWKTGEADKEKFPSGKKLTPQKLVEGVKQAAGDWKFERVSIGYPGEVRNGHPTADPYNLADGWVDFDYAKRIRLPRADHERRLHAGAGQLRRRPHAVPGPGHEPGLHVHHRRHDRAAGAGPSEAARREIV